MDLDRSVANACQAVPGLVRAALALLPEGFLVGGVGAHSTFEHEPLVRSAKRCLEVPVQASLVPAVPYVEYLFVIDDQLIAIQRGRKDPRLVLIVACTREPNLAFVL